MRRRKPEAVPQTDAVVGRELLNLYRRQNEEMVDKLEPGQQVQYFDEGWRLGCIDLLPAADERRYGQVRIEHQQTGRVWVAGRDVKPLDLDWLEYFAWAQEETHGNS